ncbi:EF-hand domain-containing protein D1 isoform X4 [Oryzias melastigma]|uniref:EF-hand domain-containing protein D1 isoform X4 n=1 Tax=Oryzias melastigma TaxID=30732 RepID=UPI000CF838D6|nr:EF-hand domain-containing protein D1 isoform X4 [Oryzias melastigma]
MASEELAKKLQSRFAAVEDTENRLEPELSPARSAPREPIGGEDCSELSAMLHRRLDINDGAAAPCATRVFNPYTEFKEFSRRQIKDMEAMFRRYDMGKDGFIDLMELKLMMEKLGAPQTHLGLKNMIREVDEDFDGKLSFREVWSRQSAVYCLLLFTSLLVASQTAYWWSFLRRRLHSVKVESSWSRRRGGGCLINSSILEKIQE